jgi:hypothetical protein
MQKGRRRYRRKYHCRDCQLSFFDKSVFDAHLQSAHLRRKNPSYFFGSQEKAMEQKPSLTLRDIKVIKAAWEKIENKKDPQIKEYLLRNPMFEKQPFGLPQGKNRRGIYGMRLAQGSPWAKRTTEKDR